VLRGLWDRHGDRVRHWLAVVITVVVVITYLESRDGDADWTVFLLAVGLLLVLEFVLQSNLFRRGSRRRNNPPDNPRR
jgi:hypothetical protein